MERSGTSSPLKLTSPITYKNNVNIKTYQKIKQQYKNNLKSDLIQLEVTEDIKQEGLRVLNDVFESAPIDDVLKIISTPKSNDTNDNQAKKSPPQQIKTYVNKRKVAVAPQSRVLESFGLPDDPIVPLYGDKLVFKRFKGLDIEKGAPESVTLVDTFIGKLFQGDLNGVCKKVENDDDIRFIDNKEIPKINKVGSNNVNNNKKILKRIDKTKMEEIKEKSIIDNSFAIIIKENYNKMTNKLNDLNKNDEKFCINNDKVEINELNQEEHEPKKNELLDKSKDKIGTRKKKKIKDIKPTIINGIHLNDLHKLIDNVNKNKSDEENVKEVPKENVSNENLKKNDVNLDENKKINRNNDELDINIFPGQLMWAKFGKFPYWPCMVTSHPETKEITRIFNRTVEVLVRFFGDRGRCSWIKKKHLLLYSSLEKLKQGLDSSKKHWARASGGSRYVRNWKSAMIEADSLKNATLQERFSFFDQVLKDQDEILKQKKIKQQLQRVAKRKLSLEEAKEKDTKSSEKNETNSPPAKRKRIKSVEEKIDNENSDENSDEEIDEKKPFPVNLNEQTSLYRRNNLFKKVTKEKVCHLCLKTGIVLRCKGKCQGFFHSECFKKNVNDLNRKSFNKKQVKIVSMKDRRGLTPTNLNLNEENDEFKRLSLSDKIDNKMNEVMKTFDDKALYLESTDSSCYESSVELNPDDLDLSIDNDRNDDICNNCSLNSSPICFICHKSDESFLKSEIKFELNDINNITNDITPKIDEDNQIQRCSSSKCYKFFHPNCLKKWPQTQWSITTSKKHNKSNSNEFICPNHVCHICVSDDPRSLTSRCYGDKLVKCVYCPTSYHMATYCIPAGTQILSTTQIICTKHFCETDNFQLNLLNSPLSHSSNSSTKTKRVLPINTTWCFICSKGGTLVCCETCPTSVHSECVAVKYADDDKFICEDCESGRFPLYDEVVWVKLGYYRWWPALILFPNEVPEKINDMKHNPGEFVVMFFGTYNYYWIGRGRVFLFEEGDAAGSSGGSGQKKRMEEVFKKSIEEATQAFLLKREFKESYKNKSRIRPPPYVKIRVNRPVGDVRLFDGNISNTTPCECSPNQENPCGPYSDCLNRLLLTECDPTVCPAGTKCLNQCFEQRTYPDLIPYKTEARGWGLKSLEPLKKGQFIIEYVGEMIDEVEYQRRIKQMNELKEDNFYFLTIDKDRMIDAGPKGNLARFMNHSCKPNCETQKWTVNGDTRVGLFALEDIPENVELTFNYNLECIGKEKKICLCGASNCSGFIGVKVNKRQVTSNNLKTRRKKRRKRSYNKNKRLLDNNKKCFVCGLTEGNLKLCDSKICSNYYHSKCVGLEKFPENNGKWICPWHKCKICTKRTSRCCMKCLNSYCPKHSSGNIRYDNKQFRFVCSVHDDLLLKSTETPDIEFVNVNEVETNLTVTNLNVISNDNLEIKNEDFLEESDQKDLDDIEVNDQNINGLIILSPITVNSIKTNLKRKRKGKRNNSTNGFRSRNKRSKVSNNDGVIEKRMLRSGLVTNNNLVSDKFECKE